MKIVSSSAGHPVATGQRLRLEEVSEAEAKPGYSAGVKWRYVNMSGEHKGKTAYRTTGMNFGPTSAAGDYLAGHLGMESLPEGFACDLEELVGRIFIAEIARSPQGHGTRVASVRPETAATPPATAQGDIPF